MEIKMLNIKDIKPYDKNPRINDEAVDHVVSSIKEYGFKVPMIIDKNNVIVAGHTRYKAAKKLGLKEVPCIVADDLSEEQVKSFRLIDNKTSEISLWDWDLLDEELSSLKDLDFDLSLFNLDDNFSILDDLENERVGERVEKSEFSITFVFPKDKEELINNYIKKHTKQKIVDKILEICESE